MIDLFKKYSFTPEEKRKTQLKATAWIARMNALMGERSKQCSRYRLVVRKKRY